MDKPSRKLICMDNQNVFLSNVDVIYGFMQGFTKHDNLEHIRGMHCQMIYNGLDSIPFLGDHFIRLFASYGSLSEASTMFRKFNKPSAYTWNAIISAHVNAGQCQSSLELFNKMKEQNINPNRITYLSIIKACYMTNALEKARIIHKEIDASNCGSNLVVENALIDMYAKFGRLDEAKTVFCNMVLRDVASWGAMISGYVQHNYSRLAIELFKEMQSEDVKPDMVIFSCVLKACGQIEALKEGKLIHGLILRGEFEPGSNLFLGNTLIDMYGKCASLEDAQITFDNMVPQDAVSWSTLIAGYTNNGFEISALQLFEEMQARRVNPVKTTYLSVLKACGNVESLHHARVLHNKIIQNEVLMDQEIGNSLLDVYTKCKQMYDAQSVFDDLVVRNDVSWNVLIAGYAGCNDYLSALKLFEEMQEKGFKPSEITVSVILKACGSTKTLEYGQSIHKKIMQNQVACDKVVQNTLIDMYIKCGNIKEAQIAFDEMLSKDIVSWGVIISGNVQHGYIRHAFELFDEMQNKNIQPNDVIFSSILKACGNIGDAREGMLVHNQVIHCGYDVNVMIENTLVDMYGKSGSLEEALKVFNNMNIRDVVSWAAMIGGYAQHGYGSHVLDIYARMQDQEIEASRVIFLHVLKACGIVGAMEYSKLVHGQILESNISSDDVIENTLINIYSKCGGIEEARIVFNKMNTKTAVTWAAMIAGYAACGNCLLAYQCIWDMKKHGLEPDGVIFSSLLSACSNSALLGEGIKYFKSMVDDFGIIPSIEHYSCMIDLLARFGVLTEARDLVSTLPYLPDPVVWRSLLANSKTYNNVELANQCFHGVFEEGSSDASDIVFMSSIYSDTQLWADIPEMQEFEINSVDQKDRKAWIEIDEQAHDLMVGGKVEPNNDFFFPKFMCVRKHPRDYDYTPQLNEKVDSMLREQDDLCLHTGVPQRHNSFIFMDFENILMKDLFEIEINPGL